MDKLLIKKKTDFDQFLPLNAEVKGFTPTKTTPTKRLPDRHRSKRRPKYGRPK